VAYYHRVLHGATHVRGGYLQYYVRDVERLPLVPWPDLDPTLQQEVNALARARLASCEGANDIERRLDNIVATAFGLDSGELEHIEKALAMVATHE
jgi:hypothetical protein